MSAYKGNNMNLIHSDRVLFLIIDIQEKLVNMLGNSSVPVNAEKLAKTANIMNLPVIITEQYPKGLGGTIHAIKNILLDSIYIEKTHFNALYEPEIKELICKENRKQIVIFGIETHICVLQTALELLNNGYEVFVVQNACGCRGEYNNDTAYKRMIHSGAQVVTVEMVIFELLKSSNHPDFKEIQALVK